MRHCLVCRCVSAWCVGALLPVVHVHHCLVCRCAVRQCLVCRCVGAWCAGASLPGVYVRDCLVCRCSVRQCLVCMCVTVNTKIKLFSHIKYFLMLSLLYPAQEYFWFCQLTLVSFGFNIYSLISNSKKKFAESQVHFTEFFRIIIFLQDFFY